MKILQDPTELDAFVDVLKAEGVRSYLEVGALYGGCLQRVGMSLLPGSRVVAVDLPNATSPECQASLTDVIYDLKLNGRDARLIWGDSTDPDVVEEVRALGPFGAVLIDANHSLPYVTKDWENYGPMGRIVAFHDIAWRRAPEWRGSRIAVPEFWESIKGGYRHQEFRFCRTGKNNGIGVLWRDA